MDITERKQLEEARQTASNRFYTVLSEMPLGVLLVTEDGLTELANQAFCDIFKLKQSPAELKNLNSDEMIEKIRNMLVNPERAVARIREIVTQEKPVRDEEVPMLGEKTVLRDFIPIQIHEKQYGRLWIHIDITDRKKMEENNSYLASFPELNSNPILELDRNGKIKYQNPACKSIFPDLFELGLTHPFLRDWENVINKLTADNSEQHVIRDIQVCDLFYEQACFRVGKNQIRIYARDITETTQAEEKLKNQFAILKGIIESPLTPIFSVDEKYCYTSFNSIHAGVMKSIYGTDIEVGKSILDYMIVEKDRNIAKANFDRALNGEHFSDEAYSGEESLNRSFFIVNHSPVKNGEGRIIGVVVFAQDITERRRLEQEKDKYNKELVEKNAELERFTYTVSHDLKSPLVTIKTFLGYLTQDMNTADKQRVEKDLLFINDAADKMGLLLQELLEMSRIGRVINPPVKITSEQLIKDAVGIMAGPIADMGVKVQVTGESVGLFGDRTRLLEIWQNLLENAVKFMGGQPSPQIEIGIERRGTDTVFFMRDNGIGIEPQYQSKIFNLFEKIDAKTEGTGMGLVIVKRIVELYQGRIWVESKGLGQGSCFRFTLPSALKEKG